MLEHILITIGLIVVSLVGLAIFRPLSRKSSETEVIAEYHIEGEVHESDLWTEEAEMAQREWRRSYAG